MLGISTSGGIGFCAKVQPHRYGYVGRLVARDAAKLPCDVPDDDRKRIGLKIEAGEMEDVLEDIRLSESGSSILLDKRFKSDRNPEDRHGRRGMTRAARHKVRGSVVALASVVPDGCMSFFTGTCPEIDWDTDRRVMSNWNKVVHVFLKRLRRKLEKAGVAADYVHVTEIQVQRWKRSSRPYLHLHLVFRGRRHPKAQWAVTHSELREDWIAALNAVAGDDPYHMAVCDLKPCDGGVGKYLSKYLSKGGETVREVEEAGLSDWFPRQWWGSSRSVVAERKKLTYTARGVEAQNLWDIMSTGGHGHTTWLYPVQVEGHGGKYYTVGYCFGLEEVSYVDLMTDGRLQPDLALI